VEIDGMTHDDEEVFKNDIIRQTYLESIGLKVVRYTSEQVIRHIRDTIDNLAWICNDRAEELKKVSSSS